MTVTIRLPADMEARLVERARVAGVDVATYVERLVRAEASKPEIDDVLRPMREAFMESGMSEDELGDMLVKAKKEMRAERAK